MLDLKFSLSWARAIRLTLASGAMVLACSVVSAQPQGEVQRLFAEGKHAEALTLVDSMLAKSPNDLQLRFQRGVVLSVLNRRPEALAVFQKIVDEQPNMVGAYNNIGVIQAAQGDYEAAKAALDKAVKTSPSYAPAYQNLGDVYTQMASQAYSKAIQLDKADGSSPAKLALLRDVLTVDARSDAANQNRKGGRSTLTGVIPPPPPMPEVRESAVVTLGGANKTAPAAPNTPATKTSAISPAIATPSAVASGTPAAMAANKASADVEASIRAWAAAWSRREVRSYLAAYTPDFIGQSKSRGTWEQERTQRITGRSFIKVDVSDFVIIVKGDKAEARFRQSYDSDTIKNVGRKTMNMERSPTGQWLIKSELSAS
jgi:tetratricopeptide (TPR) repeat protein